MIEPAAGADRAMLAFLVDAYDEDEIERRARGPCCACTPSSRRSRSRCCRWCARTASPSWRREIHRDLRERMQTEYDEGGAIGRRYRRQDEIGTPWAVTVDHQSLEDRTVTLRDRDSLAQERIAIDALGDELERRLRGRGARPKLSR